MRKKSALIFISILLIILVISCGRVRRQSNTGSPTQKETTIAKTPTQQETISKEISSVPKAGDYEIELSGWPGRQYLIHVPTNYDGKKSLPLILALHGTGGSSTYTVKLTCPNGDETSDKCMNKLADRENFFVVYPMGTIDPAQPKLSRTFNAGGGKNGYLCIQGYACEHNIDDIKYFNELLNDVEKKYKVDKNMIYATGLSNGAVMSQRLACQMADRIVAIAPVSGVNQYSTVENCNPSKPVAVVEFHGTSDSVAPYEGGKGRYDKGIRLSVSKTVSDWVQRNDCNTESKKENLPDKEKEGNTATKETYSGCESNADVVLYTISNGGHTWPDGWQYLDELLVGKTSKDINANEIMWDFFKNHPRSG